MLLSSTSCCLHVPRTRACSHMCIHHLYIHVYIQNLRIHVYLYMHKYAFMCICTCTSIHSCASVHAQVYPCIHIHLHMNIQKNAAIYMSPERMQAKPYSYAADVWALGIITTECAVGRLQPTPKTPYLQPNSHPQLQNQPSEQL